MESVGYVNDQMLPCSNENFQASLEGRKSVEQYDPTNYDLKRECDICDPVLCCLANPQDLVIVD